MPVFVNGDIRCLASAREALRLSGASGIMIGRGAYGAPWLPGALATALQGDSELVRPAIAGASRSCRSTCLSHAPALRHQARPAKGAKTYRVGTFRQVGAITSRVKAWRGKLCREDNSDRLLAGLAEFYDQSLELAA